MKKYLTIEERIEKLKKQGLIINNNEFFNEKVNEIGYYKLINGYRHVFIDNSKQYYNNVKFEEFLALYEFDNKLRNITLKAICDFEINIKSLISELFSKKYSIDDSKYFTEENFNFKKDFDFNSFKEKFLKETNKILKAYNEQGKIFNSAVINFYSKYKILPLWIIMKNATIGNVSIFYSIMKETDRIAIAKEFNLFSVYLENYLKNITLFRNVCAHNERLFDFKTENAIRMKSYRGFYTKLKIDFNEKTNLFQFGSKDYMSLIIMLKLLTPKKKFNEFIMQIKTNLKHLKSKINKVSYLKVCRSLGLNKNWLKIKNINR